MPTFNVDAWIRIPASGQTWNGSSWETPTQPQHINTQVNAGDYFQAKAIVESQYDLCSPPVITEVR